MLVLLGPLFVGDVDPLTGQFALAEGAGAGDDVNQRVVGRLRQKLGAVVLLAGRPGVNHVLQMPDQRVGGHREVLAAPVGVIRSGVVRHRPISGTVRIQILSPQQELDGVPAGGDVCLAAFLVEGDDEVRVDFRVFVRHVDDAGRGIALNVVDVGLVYGPGVDQPFRTVFFVVDGTAIEPEHLGGTVVVPGAKPCALGRFEGCRVGIGQEGVYGRIHHLGRRQALGVQGVYAVCVMCHHFALQRFYVNFGIHHRSRRGRRRRWRWFVGASKGNQQRAQRHRCNRNCDSGRYSDHQDPPEYSAGSLPFGRD